MNLHDVEKKEVLQQSQNECVSVPSTVQEDSACNQPYRDAKSAYEENHNSYSPSEAPSTVSMDTGIAQALVHL